MDLISTLDFCQTALGGQGIPTAVGKLVHLVFVAFQIVVPLLLIIWGMLDFAKAVIAQKEDDIKAGQSKFMKRLIAALIVFLIVTIVQLAINVVGNLQADSDQSGSAWTCAKALINGQDGQG